MHIFLFTLKKSDTGHFVTYSMDILWCLCVVEKMELRLRDNFNLLARTFTIGVDLRIGEGNGTPLQYPCLENPMDRGAW